jgi:hypothetical protein
MRCVAAVATLSALTAPVHAAGGAVVVTAENFARAESDNYFKMLVDRGGFGKFSHRRDLPLEGTGVRPNRDTLYSLGVFDLDAGPVTITIPDAGKRFISLQATNEDHYVYGVAYNAGPHTYKKGDVGTRYMMATVRIFVDPNDAADMDRARALQDQVRVSQPGGPGTFESPSWDQESQKKIRDALMTLGETLPDWRGAGGQRAEVDPVRHLIVSATGWGLAPDKDAIYLNFTPPRNDGQFVYRLTVPANVPVGAFWSISVYNRQGRFEKNQNGVYTINNVTANKSEDGSVAVQFGGCDGKSPNCLPTMSGWNYIVRLYRPGRELLDGSWKFPEARLVN